tara:strand:- start:1370 stop:2149 length:780 start_codon:yes stop_codon:yes gene_type:complete
MKDKPWIRGSASAFMWGRTVYTKYSGSCLRSILIKNTTNLRTDIDPSHQVRGAFNEEEYERHLQQSGIPYVREEEVVDGPLSGHIDFFLTDEPGEVIELKSSQSKSRKSDIKTGKYVVENLAQAVNYMVMKKVVNGRLIYSFWEQEADNTLTYKFNYVHKIKLDDFGRVWLNGVVTQWTVYDLKAHQFYALKVQEEMLVWDRPHNWDLMWGSPCTFCSFAKTCDKYDAGEITDTQDFIDSAIRGVVPLSITTVEEVINE